MFKNYFKITWRNIKRQPFFTFLNVLGLSVGIAGGLLISLYIYNEMSFDRMFPDANRIYRLDSDIKFGGNENTYAEVSAPMAGALQRDFPQLETTMRLRTLGSLLIRRSGSEVNAKELHTTYADSTFFDMLGIKLLYGNPQTALTNPNTLILTKAAAKKYFNLKNAVGQTLILNNKDTYTVTGVVENMPQNSFLRDYSVFMAMAGYKDASALDWGSDNYYTLVKLIPGAHLKDLKVTLKKMFDKYVIPWAQNYFPGITKEQFLASGNYFRYGITPLTNIHLYSSRESEMSANSSIQKIYILFFIALFLILLASVNFMNLSTANSFKRAKEVGIRKALGSNKSELIRQFLTESCLISFISLLLAMVIAVLAIPFFNQLAGKDIQIPFGNPLFWVVLVFATVILGVFSGSYPAFFMSRFIPVRVLKGIGKNSVGSGNIRNILVIFQFTISIFLIISTLVIFQQLSFIQKKDLGFNRKQVMIVEDLYPIKDRIQTLKEEIQRISQVKSVTLSSYFPTPSSRNNSSFFLEGHTEQENALSMQNWGVDYDYMSTLGLHLLQGRFFDRKYATDSTAIILNESAVKILGLQPKDVIGMRFVDQFGQDKKVRFLTVIGVIKNFNFDSLRKKIGALSLSLGNSPRMIGIKIISGDLQQTIADIETVWKKVAPSQPFNYYFMEDSFNNTYRTEWRLGRIFTIFTILSLLIACLGLFGLSAFNAEKRAKEVGIRKVMGANIGQIVYKLSFDFLKLVVIAILLSLPLGWIAMNRWLKDFSYRINIPWWIFAIAALLAILIALLTVSFQAIKTAIQNPVKSLRTE